MPSRRQQLPASWQGYGTDGRQTSQESGLSYNQVQFDEESQQQPEDGRLSLPPQGPLNMRRRSSVVDRMRQAGGVNSFDNFARSWQRAAGFYEVTPVRQSFRYADGEEGENEGGQPQYGATPKGQRSLLRAALENEETRHQSVFEDEEDVATPLAEAPPEVREQQPLLHERASKAHEDNIFSIEPSLASPFGGSYGSTWGSLASRVNEPSMRHAGRLFRQQQVKGTSEPDKEREPLLVKQIQEDDGKVVNVVVGQSTLPQTIFNSVNVLIGVGILALPLAFKMSGWIPGLIFFAFAGISTSYTAKLLAKCADVDGS
ncbi:vacuolar amino acid transporter-like protein 1, partial [Hortaea werneckii]